MTGPVVVLDAEVLDRASLNQEFCWVLHEVVSRGSDPVIPAVLLAEVDTDRTTERPNDWTTERPEDRKTERPDDALANQIVAWPGTVATVEPTARLAGHLRFRAGRASGHPIPSGIDAIVASQIALAGQGVVFTTVPSDLQLLLADHPQVMVDTP